jgi:mevalonate kinase
MLSGQEIADWREGHMDALVERAVKAEMQRDELLRAAQRVLEQFGVSHKHLYAIEATRKAVAKAEDRNARS